MSKCPPFRKKEIAVLFAMSDSIYKTFPECDVYDADRNALTFNGGKPVIAHPPCRLFSKLRRFSTADKSEKKLAYWAVDTVRKNGGVLEHPFKSKLWEEKNLPKPNQKDKWGFTIALPQFWFGHKALKRTFFYICGLDIKNLPAIRFNLGEPGYGFESTACNSGKLKVLPKKRTFLHPRGIGQMAYPSCQPLQTT